MVNTKFRSIKCGMMFNSVVVIYVYRYKMADHMASTCVWWDAVALGLLIGCFINMCLVTAIVLREFWRLRRDVEVMRRDVDLVRRTVGVQVHEVKAQMGWLRPWAQRVSRLLGWCRCAPVGECLSGRDAGSRTDAETQTTQSVERVEMRRRADGDVERVGVGASCEDLGDYVEMKPIVRVQSELNSPKKRPL